jgi:phosphatidylinositol glycan class V
VGLFRYYEARQIPNFVLALPVLALSFAAVSTWIARSWDRHGANREAGTTGTGVRGVTASALRWAFLALDASSGHASAGGGIPSNASSGTRTLLLGPELLPHYAVLAGFALVGTFVAHVQVSTRLIFSSCPAIYWFLSGVLVRPTANDQKGDVGKGCSWQRAAQAPWFIYSYFALYNILGVIMHVNWLPWT